MKPWKTDTQILAPYFTIFMNRTTINVRPWNNFKRKELKIIFFPSLTDIYSFIWNWNSFYLIRGQDMFQQKVAYIKNIFIICFTCAIPLRLMCNYSIKPLSRIVQKRRKTGKNVEMNHWLISDVGIWKLVGSLLRRETNWLSCLYVIKKKEASW